MQIRFLIPTAAAAAEYYPGVYWYSMMKIPGGPSVPLGPPPRELPTL